MKDKDPNEDEFNKDEQDNINEADDSFGLPDLDFNTLDDEPEDSSDEAEETEEVVETTKEEVDEVIAESEEETAEDVADEASEEEVEEEESKPGTTYVPPKAESNTPRIVGALIITVLLSGAIWYFMFYRPQVAAEEKAKQEQLAKDQEAARIAAAKKKQEEERLAAEQAANAEADADEASAQTAEFSTISAPTGRYYIVIGSFLDGDMGADYGNKLKEKGISTFLLSPKGTKKFHRLTMGDFGTFIEAQEAANKLKGEFGDDLWVLKY
jgi:septum formation inhibitor MinC